MMNQSSKQWQRKLHQTAIHEAGHVVVAHAVGARVHRVTIKPGRDYLGRVRHGKLFSEAEYYAADDLAQVKFARHVKIALAGGLAEKRAFPRSRWRDGTGPDFHVVADLVVLMYHNDKARYHWLQLLTIETETLLERYWSPLELLASELIAVETLSGAQAVHVIRVARAREVAGHLREGGKHDQADAMFADVADLPSGASACDLERRASDHVHELDPPASLVSH